MDIERMKAIALKKGKSTVYCLFTFFARNVQKIIFSTLAAMLLLLGWWGFNRARPVTLSGEVLSHPYTIKYVAKRGKKYQPELDSLLSAIVQALDSRLPNSDISRLNDTNTNSIKLNYSFLYTLLIKCKILHEQTQHVFDPTVVPLVALWQKCLSLKERPPIQALQIAQSYIGLDYIVVNEKRAKKLKEGVMLNLDSLLFSYIADEVAALLRKLGVSSYYLTVGNAVLIEGYNPKKVPKASHILTVDDSDKQTLTFHIPPSSKASIRIGSLHQAEGKKQPLIVNPLTGDLAEDLGAIVFAKDCTTAYAWGITILLKGLKESATLLDGAQEVSALAIYKNESGKPLFHTTPGLTVEPGKKSNHFYMKLAALPG
jgi:thiamine biosynthesis lipoprotein